MTPRSPVLKSLLIALALTSTASGQQGDRAGETQPPLPESLVVPASPPLEPSEALAGFTLPEGLTVELVAAEPIVIAPVTSVFGPDGRLWVVEMPGYMSDLDGTQELEPTGRIVALTDSDQDGTMDSRQVFLDELVLPRALAIVEGGILVVAPPNLIYARDTDGDGTADETTILDTSFGGLDSPEHAGNGLRYGLDNWLHCSQHAWEYRFQDGQIQRRGVPPHGQWGITSDAWGQWYYTPNSYPLMVDLLPKHVISMNPSQRDHAGAYIHLPADQEVHSVRINPGVNRAYRPETLNDDFTLRHFTAACGPTIYLDSVLGDDYEGDAFICEPSGNTVEHRNLIERAHQAPELRTDPMIGAIIASTDERFRPVHAETGPDGNLYITDLYRGILQHKIFMTSFLRAQVVARGLDTPVDRGRIWRIVPDDGLTRFPPDLTVLDDATLIKKLDDRNGTVRRLTQQLLVDRETLSPEALESLQEMAGASGTPLGQTHALWTLDGRSELEPMLLLEAMETPNVNVRVQAIRIAANHLEVPGVEEALLSDLKHQDKTIRRLAAASLALADASRIAPELALALDSDPSDKILRTAIIAGARGQEVSLLQSLAMHDTWIGSATDPRRAMSASIARTAARANVAKQNLALLELLAALPPDQEWLAEVVAEEVAKIHRLRSATPRTIELSAAPFDWNGRLEEEADLAGGLLRLIDSHSTWPGRPGYQPDIDVSGLDATQAKLLQKGANLYTHCTGCHQATGLGLRGFYPPLADSPFVLGHAEPLLGILIKGLEGPLEIDGAIYNQPMPPAPVQEDEDLAAIASFIRHSFGNDASPVSIEEVIATRERLKNHEGPLTIELLEVIWP
ncbi:MAG: c-type cytochrome [Planctomycetota bacterium]|nr:c-type cytochrome [Planctomycetota bacterium]